jgi:ATP-binding cassette subfamily F protein uup
VILVNLEGASARRPDRPLFEDLSLTLSTGDRLGVVGRNGCGKSTLLRALAGVEGPEEGTVRRGRDVRVGFLAQRPVLPPGDVRSAVGDHWEAAAILERMGMGGLTGADVATLSGGQAKPGSWSTRSTSWSWTSPPTTSTSTPSPGWKTAWPGSGEGWWW